MQVGRVPTGGRMKRIRHAGCQRRKEHQPHRQPHHPRAVQLGFAGCGQACHGSNYRSSFRQLQHVPNQLLGRASQRLQFAAHKRKLRLQLSHLGGAGARGFAGFTATCGTLGGLDDLDRTHCIHFFLPKLTVAPKTEPGRSAERDQRGLPTPIGDSKSRC